MANDARPTLTTATACAMRSHFLRSLFRARRYAAEEALPRAAADASAQDRAFNAAKATHQKHIDDLRKESLEDSLERLC